MPANSVTTRPTLATAKARTAKAERRSENCSRMSAARPLPVWAARRATISWMQTYPTVTRTMKNRVRYPNWAPAEA